ncbi:MotA/TolQ/ExbB proton channel family protein [Nitrogeniibacter mangrovi]|uniref:Biopolymer transport protein ExbB n=1 Tax=Nitrogeniibacter mangrovi TaxID=2016596 RepID=A0A6C1B1Y7_9RHOO|nr:MotA/TolQ/ExbB proton channel family protein [Nitrogeniibacter mangrovi]QID16838.1 MotA/TolQ/ExbB proton channel family protein [Nitrogeniibacter mangrovi]
MDAQNAFGVAQLWAQSDLITRSVALLLVIMSVISWYLIVTKGLRLIANRRHAGAIESFWQAATLDEGLAGLHKRAKDAPCTRVAAQAAAAQAHCTRHAADATLGSTLDTGEFITRALRRGIAESTAVLERGLTVLASIGSTAPFIGLFGTVWGIYHALTTISVTGAASIDKVAGPVGEALIMTAFGLFVAIPAVLAYNGFNRANRVELSELDGFAHDLHAFFTTGARVGATAMVKPIGKNPARPAANEVA